MKYPIRRIERTEEDEKEILRMRGIHGNRFSDEEIVFFKRQREEWGGFATYK